MSGISGKLSGVNALLHLNPTFCQIAPRNGHILFAVAVRMNVLLLKVSTCVSEPINTVYVSLYRYTKWFVCE